MLTIAMTPGTILGASLIIAFGLVLLLITVTRARPRTFPIVTSALLLVLSLLAIALLPLPIPVPIMAVVLVAGTVLAIVGGDPFTRWILSLTTHNLVREGPNGGILLRPPATAADPAPEIMRGGATIGHLERAASALAIIAGYPEAIAVVVAIKGIARFRELESPEARERFIIGTLASLGWACVAAATVRLAMG